MCTTDVSVYTVVLVIKGVLEKMPLRVKEAFLTSDCPIVTKVMCFVCTQRILEKLLFESLILF